MVVLCPTHHAELGKLPRSRAYSAKENPINIRHQRLQGFLGGNGLHTGLTIGKIDFAACRNAISYSGLPIFSYRRHDGETLLSLFYPDDNLWPEIEISDNEMKANISEFWDIEFKTNWVKFRRKSRDISLSVDFTGERVTIMGYLEILGTRLSMTTKELRWGDVSLTGSGISGGNETALDIGPTGQQVISPNFAMRDPKPLFLKRDNSS